MGEHVKSYMIKSTSFKCISEEIDNSLGTRNSEDALMVKA